MASMRILLLALLCLCYCCSALADQRTTFLTEHISTGKVQLQLPVVDGNVNTALEGQVNDLLRREALKLAKDAGAGTVSYTVTLNRPSLAGVLLEAPDLGLYRAVNIDLTTGQRLDLGDFFRNGGEYGTLVGLEQDVLLAEDGLRLRSTAGGAYDRLIPYSQLLTSLRIGEAGRIFQLTRLTKKAHNREVRVAAGSLLALMLDSNPSTGYGWHAQLPQGIERVGSSFTLPQADAERMGAMGKEFMVLAALEPGSYQLRLQYKRAWETMAIDNLCINLIVE